MEKRSWIVTLGTAVVIAVIAAWIYDRLRAWFAQASSDSSAPVARVLSILDTVNIDTVADAHNPGVAAAEGLDKGDKGCGCV